jgi:hypothetical protein
MRKLLFDTEREEARAAAQEHLMQRGGMFMGMTPEMMAAAGPNGGGGNGSNGPPPPTPPNMPPMPPGMFPSPAAMAAMMGKNGMPPLPPGANPEAYHQMFHFMGNMPRGPFPLPPVVAPPPQAEEATGSDTEKQVDV